MASIKVSNNPSTTSDTLIINYTISDISNITNIQLSLDDGVSYINPMTYSTTSATFSIADWDNGTYSNCTLRVSYTAESSGEGGGGVQTVPCTGITISKSTLTFTGSSPQTLSASVTPSNTTDTISWSTNNSSVATVSGGIVSPGSNGNAIITATCGNYSATCNVTVNITTSIACTGISLNTTSITFTEENSITLVATPTPSNTTDSITWSTSSSAIATVSNGVVTPVSNGSCIIYVVCGDYSAQCNVTVNIVHTVPCTGITISKSSLTFTDDSPQTLSVTVTPSDTTDIVLWETSSSEIATVNNGEVTPVSNGSCTITARCGNYSANCSVLVNISASTSTGEILSPTWTAGRGIDTSGIEQEYTDYSATPYISLGSYTYLQYYVPADSQYCAYYDSSMNYLQSLTVYKTGGSTAIPSGASYMRISMLTTNVSSSVLKLVAPSGSSDVEWKYSTSYTISWVSGETVSTSNGTTSSDTSSIRTGKLYCYLARTLKIKNKSTAGVIAFYGLDGNFISGSSVKGSSLSSTTNITVPVGAERFIYSTESGRESKVTITPIA